MEKALKKKKKKWYRQEWKISGASDCQKESHDAGWRRQRRKWRRRLQTPIPGRWITDVWPKAAWLNCKTKKTHLLFHSPVSYFSFFSQTRFHPSLPSVSEHYYYFPLWFTFLASVFTLSVPWRTPWSVLSTDGKYHFLVSRERGGWEISQNHCCQQRAFFFLYIFCLKNAIWNRVINLEIKFKTATVNEG